MRTMTLTHGLGQQGTKGDLNALHRIHYQEPQFSVKVVQIENIIETHSLKKPMRTVSVVINLQRK